jgi:hypothetical protein
MVVVNKTPNAAPYFRKTTPLQDPHIPSNPSQRRGIPEKQLATGDQRNTWDTAGAIRREWDSNPRAPRRACGFQDRCIRPLCHLSVYRNHCPIRLLALLAYSTTESFLAIFHH